MRTTIDIPHELLADAMRAAHAKTKTMTVVLGLKELVHRHQLEQLRALRGRVPLTLDVRQSRKR